MNMKHGDRLYTQPQNVRRLSDDEHKLLMMFIADAYKSNAGTISKNTAIAAAKYVGAAATGSASWMHATYQRKVSDD